MSGGFEKISSLFFLFVLVFVLCSTAAAQEGEVIRNGDFSEGQAHWNINPKIGSNWKPFEEDAVILQAPGGVWQGFEGELIYQNLNVGGVAGASFDFSMDLSKAYSYPTEGTTIGVELTYVKGPAGEETFGFLEVDMPANADVSEDPENPTRVERVVSLPADAQRLVKLSVSRQGDGTFTADNISLAARSGEVTADPVPRITGLSATEGAYGDSLTLSGTGFGESPGLVSMGGSSAGVQVESWSDTSIEVSIEDPARSGWVYVVAGLVQSDLRHAFRITSPNYTVDLIRDVRSVVKGQTAEYVIRVDFHNDFETAEGITFAMEEAAALPAGARLMFTPVPVMNDGGALLKLDTADVAPGDYTLLLKAEEAGIQPRHVPFELQVVTIDEIRFVDPDTGEDVEAATLTTQGRFNDYSSELFEIEAVDSTGRTRPLFNFGAGAGPLRVESGDPSVVAVHHTDWGPEYYALAGGTAEILVFGADGSEASLPVTVEIPPDAPRITGISVSPAAVSYNYEGDLSFSATATHPLDSFGTYVSGNAEFRSTFSDNLDFSDGNKSASSVFKLGNQAGPQEPGIFTVLFNARTSDGTSTAVGYAALNMVPDEALSQLKGGVRRVDDLFAEHFLLEFFDEDGGKAHEREFFLPHREDFHLGDIPPGEYRLRFTFLGGFERRVWYPNADDMEGAEPLSFTAGGTVEDIYFFLKRGPGISFAGSVRASDGASMGDGGPVAGAGVSVVDNYDLWTETDSNGAFELTRVPADHPFALEITHDEYVPVYSSTFVEDRDVAAPRPFVMFTLDELQGWRLGDLPLWEDGKGVIAGRVVESGNPARAVEGAEVSYWSQNNGEYQVAYFDGESFYSGETAATSANGLYFVFGVEPWDKVTVDAVGDGWVFEGPAFHTVYGNAVHQGPVLGSAVEPDLGQAIRALRLAAGEPADPAGIRDIDRDGRVGPLEAVWVLQVLAGTR